MKTDSDLGRPELRSEACFDAEVVPHLLSREDRQRARVGPSHYFAARRWLLAETQKIAPGSVAVTADSPNRKEDSKASPGGTPRPWKAPTMAPSRTPPPP